MHKDLQIWYCSEKLSVNKPNQIKDLIKLIIRAFDTELGKVKKVGKMAARIYLFIIHIGLLILCTIFKL